MHAINYSNMKVLEPLQEFNATISLVIEKLEDPNSKPKILRDNLVAIGEGRSIFNAVLVK